MNDVARGAMAGLVGGFLASMAMNGFQEMVRSLGEAASGDSGGGGAGQGQDAGNEQDRSGGGGGGEQGGGGEGSESSEPATVKAAEKLSRAALQRDLTETEKKVAGPAVHYGYGTLWGGIYGGVAEALPFTTAVFGLPFGAALWLLGDELAVPALGLSRSPTEYPATTHLQALGSHLVYGLVVDLVRRGLLATER